MCNIILCSENSFFRTFAHVNRNIIIVVVPYCTRRRLRARWTFSHGPRRNKTMHPPTRTRRERFVVPNKTIFSAWISPIWYCVFNYNILLCAVEISRDHHRVRTPIVTCKSSCLLPRTFEATDRGCRAIYANRQYIYSVPGLFGSMSVFARLARSISKTRTNYEKKKRHDCMNVPRMIYKLKAVRQQRSSHNRVESRTQ